MVAVTVKTSLLLCFVGHAVCRPQEEAVQPRQKQSSKNDITIVKSDIVPLDAHGSASYDIELSDGTKLKQAERTERPPQGETGSPSIVIEGSYSYIAPDGREISIRYIADKNGFQPKGDAIPSNGLSPSSSSTPASAEPPSLLQSSPAIDIPVRSLDTVSNTVEKEPHQQAASQIVNEETAGSQVQQQQPQSFDAPVFEKR